MKTRTSIVTYLLLQVLFITLAETFGIKITYKSMDCNRCKLEEHYFVKLVQFSLKGCVEECAKRKQCKSLHYLKRFGLCELQDFEDNSADATNNGQCNAPGRDEQCTYVRRQDVHVSGEPDICKNCDEGKVCDWKSNECIYSECARKKLCGVILHGNMNSVGSRIKFTCITGYEKMRRDSMYSICKDNGQWDPQPQCLQNVALNKNAVADMSSLWDNENNVNTMASKGVDGLTDQQFKIDATNSCFHTRREKNPWWRVDLGDVFNISLVRIFNRIDNDLGNRTNNVVLAVGNELNNMTDVAYKEGQIKDIDDFILVPEISARFLKLWLNTTEYFNVCEVQVLAQT